GKTGRPHSFYDRIDQHPSRGCERSDDEQRRSAADVVIKMDDILRQQSHTATGNRLAYGAFVGVTVDAVERVHFTLMNVERTRPHGVVRTRLHAVPVNLKLR